jgi:large subunit ribosomal protein L37Ae
VRAMAKRTVKAGSSGRYGARYGVVTRKLTRDIEKVQRSRFECPSCHHMSVKRVGSGIWSCRHCETKFAAACYTPKTREAVSKEIAAANKE